MKYIKPITENMLAISSGFVVIMLPNIMHYLNLGNSNIWDVLILGLVIVILLGTLHLLGALFIKSDSGIVGHDHNEDYQLLEHTFSGWTAFFATWMLTVSLLTGIGLYSNWLVTHLIIPAVITLDLQFQVEIFSRVALYLNGVFPSWIYFIGIIVLLLTGILVRIESKILIFGALVLAILSTIILWLTLHTPNNSQLEQYWMGYQAYSSLLGIPSNKVTLFIHSKEVVIAAIIPLSYWIFAGSSFSLHSPENIAPSQLSPDIHSTKVRNRVNMLGHALLLVVGVGLSFAMIGGPLSSYQKVVSDSISTADQFIATSPPPPVMLVAGTSSTSIVQYLLIVFGYFLWGLLLLYTMARECVAKLECWIKRKDVPDTWTIDNRDRISLKALFGMLSIAMLLMFLCATMDVPVIAYIALFSIYYFFVISAAVVRQTGNVAFLMKGKAANSSCYGLTNIIVISIYYCAVFVILSIWLGVLIQWKSTDSLFSSLPVFLAVVVGSMIAAELRVNRVTT
ncbi:hypothetical protein ACFL6R_06915 [Gemmatimonadota bacterium]